MRSASRADQKGAPLSLGASASGEGTWFSVEAPNATQVDLCLFEAGEAAESQRLTMDKGPDGIHRLFVAAVGPGQHYGYRAFGPADPEGGHYFNPRKLLVDPWARRVTGPTTFHPSQRTLDAHGKPDGTDSAVAMLRSVVVEAAPTREWSRPHVPMADSVIYECHVRGMTALHPEVPTELRGTFLGMCELRILEHLQLLSVTTVSLLPVAVTYVEEHLVDKGLTNYWGYAPFAAFAPDPRFATVGGDPVAEFRQMVETFHSEGIEVLLDVVFNHSGEGSAAGATVSFRGLDSAAFYAFSKVRPREALDFTGCGNSFALTSPTCLRYVMDALRYWVTDMGVDGFRFDLATTLARGSGGFDVEGPFLSAIQQDPVLRQVKLVAEPWDVAAFGYRLGGFPPGFSEWNDRYRDTVRRFYRGEPHTAAELATRLSGSSDVFGHPLRGPKASINFVISHDGFTLLDLVTYERRHNEANGEQGRDGHGENFSQNFGVEGPTTSRIVQSARMTTARAMLLTLATSQGVPMIAHGDELGRSQVGNNNAYCQDGLVTHVNWEHPLIQEFLPFARAVFAARARHPCLRPALHMHGEEQHGRPDLTWLRPDGRVMDAESWSDLAFAVRICGEIGDGVLLLLNGSGLPCRFVVPRADPRHIWGMVVEAGMAAPHGGEERRIVVVGPQSAALLEQRRRT